MATGKVGRLQTPAQGLAAQRAAAGGAGGSGCAECRELGLEETPGEEKREFSSREAGSGGSGEARAGKGVSQHEGGMCAGTSGSRGDGVRRVGGGRQAGEESGVRTPSGCRGRECPGVTRGSGWGPRSLLRARLGVASEPEVFRGPVPSGRGGDSRSPLEPRAAPARTPDPLPTYAGRHIDEVEQRGREREEKERGEQRAARQPQQPPANAHAAAGRPLEGRAGPAPAAPRPSPPGPPPPPPGPRPPPPRPRRPPLAAASPLPAAGLHGPGHMKRAGARAAPSERSGGGGATCEGAGRGGAGPTPPGTVAKDPRARARALSPPGPHGRAAALRERRQMATSLSTRPPPRLLGNVIQELVASAQGPPQSRGQGRQVGQEIWDCRRERLGMHLHSFNSPFVERQTYARYRSGCWGGYREQNRQNLFFMKLTNGRRKGNINS